MMRSEGGRAVIHAVRIPIDWRPELSIYASEPFLRAVGDEYGWIGGIGCSGWLRCILPYTIVRKAIFRMARFRVETIPLGEEMAPREEKGFLNAAVGLLRSIGADMIIPASNNAIFRTYPDGAVAAPYGSLVIDLDLDEGVLWSNLYSKNRNMIRKAMKSGVEVRTGLEHLGTCYELIAATLKRSSLSFMSYDSFKRLIHALAGNVQLFVATHKGLVQGCAVFFYSSYAAYYVYGGSIPGPQGGAINLLIWEAMRYFKEIGVHRYDFVGVRIDPAQGSKQYRLMRFKQQFGGRHVQGYMWKYSFNPVKFAAYALAVKLLRGGDIVDVERHKLLDDKLDVRSGMIGEQAGGSVYCRE